jgi:Tol biopolymer transport system component
MVIVLVSLTPGEAENSRVPIHKAEPAWSPDGEKIAFESNRDGNSDIYVMNVDGSNIRRLTTDPAIDCRPAWSPDGTKIAFQSQRSGHWDIYIMNADGSNQIALTRDSAFDASPTWSPDGLRKGWKS